MKQISATLLATLILFTFSCNNGGNNQNQAADTATNNTTAAAIPEPAFTPFTLMVVKHKVKNFDTWKTAYMAHDSVRLAYGIHQYRLARGLDDSNMVSVMQKIDDIQKAKEFAKLPNLKDAMKKGGVISTPAFSYINVISNDDSPIDQNERVMVVHHVKDFDTWMKAYNAEGKDTRAANGLVERGMGRGVDDSNMVYIVFAVTDMAKAKARIASPELKKIMTDAGVDSAPKIYFYRLTD